MRGDEVVRGKVWEPQVARMVKRVFKTAELEALWQERYESTLNQFDLPDKRLLCGFDDEKSGWFEGFGYHDARGLHTPWQGSGSLPQFLEPDPFDSDDGVYDSLIYIPLVPPTTYPFIFAVTFAHELQHFVQRCDMPRVLEANAFLCSVLPELDSTVLQYATWYIPAERDAMTRSKEVAEALFGIQTVQEKASLLASGHFNSEEWRYFLELSSSTTCNVLHETDALVKKYSGGLARLQRDWPPGIDFRTKQWWA